MGRLSGGMNFCPVPGCKRYKPQSFIACRVCIIKIPDDLQLEVYRLWNRGMHLPGYHDARDRAIAYATDDQTPF